jgi:hypothetical protein
MDLDPDPAIFVIAIQDANKKLILKKSFSACYSLKVHLRQVTKQLGIKVFLTIFG